MRHKLALTIALAGFCALTALGADMAGATPPSAAQSTTPLETTATTTAASQPSCPEKAERRGGSSSAETEAAASPCQPRSGSGEEQATTPSAGVKHGATISPGASTPKGGNQTGKGPSEGRSTATKTMSGRNGGLSAPGTRSAGKARQKSSGKGADNGGSSAGSNSTAGGSLGAVIGVSDFGIGSFEIPPLLLPVYQACGTQYGIPWEVLAAINKVETDFGSNLGPSSAGAEGWMQFLPSTWATWGVDGNGDGRKDPNNPVDAICAAARYLAAAGGGKNIYKAVFAYNHAGWYVHEVLSDAANYESLPANLISALSQLAEGSQFPVQGHVSYADNAGVTEALQRNWLSEATASSAAKRAHPGAAGVDIFATAGSPVVAVANGTIVTVGHSARLGNYMVLRDPYGSLFTYANLGQIRSRYRTPRLRQPSLPAAELTAMRTTAPDLAATGARSSRRRLYALPNRPANRARAAALGQLGASPVATREQRLSSGARVVAGTVLAVVGGSGSGAHIDFSIQPDGSPKIDPTAILDGWKQGGAAKVFHISRPLWAKASPAQVLLLSGQSLRRRSLADARLSLPPCEQSAIRAGEVEPRVLAGIEYLTARGFKLGVSASTCVHQNGFAVKISRVDGAPVAGGPGTGASSSSTSSPSSSHALVRTTLQMQGATGPQKVLSRMSLGGVSVASQAQPRLIDLDFNPPQAATLVNGRAIAPVNAPPAIQAMIAAANHISTTPYIWGGGHGSWNSPGYDCSGSVSYVLHAARLLATPLTSGALAGWGQPGAGRWVTIYANATHTYAEIAGLRWDTVGDAQGSGPRWHTEAPYPAGFVVRHPAGY
ncbi:MAG TPA: lytic murein transglycosylase [Solirubrobacterales bacterium]|nr:lytic murein transglycosylase [Solirubrobacterales bacterium]